VYVSCNPTTLAGNVKELQREWGYSLVRVRPVDMFPHTPHVEAVALLARTAASGV
jgi:23S rRNA (uracil1939-C5)-methyltransferase